MASLRFATGEVLPLTHGEPVEIGREGVVPDSDAAWVSRAQAKITLTSEDTIAVEALGQNLTGVCDRGRWNWLRRGSTREVHAGTTVLSHRRPS